MRQWDKSLTKQFNVERDILNTPAICPQVQGFSIIHVNDLQKWLSVVIALSNFLTKMRVPVTTKLSLGASEADSKCQ